MKDEITAIILAGGKSSRMGRDKSLLQLGNKAFIEHVVDSLRPYVKSIIVVTNDKEKYAFLNDVLFVSDIKKDQGPFIGMISGLGTMSTDWAFITSCDTPLVNGSIIDHLWSFRSGFIVSPFNDHGFEALMSLYSKEILPYAAVDMEQGNRSINKFISKMDKIGKVKRIDKFSMKKYYEDFNFLNVNDEDDYRRLLEVFNGK